MSSRQGKIESGGVQLFPFLAVLLCTMGALLVLLVVLGERAKNAALAEAAEQTRSPAPRADLTDGGRGLPVEEAARRLADLKRTEARRKQLHEQALARESGEKARLTHVEEHERRLEHELAKMHLVLQQLDAAEQRQQVDQQTAEEEAQRLKELVTEAEQQLEQMRKENQGKKSYAILPYQGSSGTYRRPIYVECTADAVVIHPEGIRLVVDDFVNPMSSATPLAAAIRAAQEELNARARAAGETASADPYPLIVVRPDGITAHNLCKLIVTSWGGEYGVEFIEQDWQLEYPAPDPRLAQVMTHAVQQARERQALMARAAPRRYGERLNRDYGGVGGESGASTGGGYGYSLVAGGGGGDGPPALAADNRYGAVGVGEGGGGTFAEQVEPGAAAGASAAAAPGASGGTAADAVAAGGDAAQAANVNDGKQGAPGHGGGIQESGRPTGGIAGSGGSAAGPAAPGAAGGGSPGNAPGSIGAPVSFGATDAGADSAAKSRGSNWANEAARRRATPIARPIHLAVQPDKLTLSADSTGGQAGKPISFHQPTDLVLNELAAEIKRHMEEWGFAGQGMYWRPMLVFEVAPGAERYAERLQALLVDSGVDVRLERIAQLPQVEK